MPISKMFENSLSYPGALIRNSISAEIRNANTIDAFVKNIKPWHVISNNVAFWQV